MLNEKVDDNKSKWKKSQPKQNLVTQLILSDLFNREIKYPQVSNYY